MTQMGHGIDIIDWGGDVGGHGALLVVVKESVGFVKCHENEVSIIVTY
jgi:hypothetical protein